MAITVVPFLALVALGPLVAIDGVFLVETFLGLARPRPSAIAESLSQSVAILMPAYNEAAALTASNAMLKRLIEQGARIVVVADNCTDATATVAAAAGCEVVMRSDPVRRGKGYALAAGRDYLLQNPPEIVVVLDADCSIDDESLSVLAARAAASRRVVQAAYLFRYDPLASAKVQISNFAFAHKNLVRQRGARRLGAAAILAGSGMAFPWTTIAKLDLATANIVEDLTLGIDLVLQQRAPIFEESARVLSDATTGKGMATQRSRWEGGFIIAARQFAWPLLLQGLARRDFKRFWLGAHLMVPALSIVLAVNLAVVLLCCALAVLTSATLPAACATILVALIAVAVVASWFIEGRRHMSPQVMLQIPVYLGWKIGLYWRMAIGRQAVAWTRTDRVNKD